MLSLTDRQLRGKCTMCSWFPAGPTPLTACTASLCYSYPIVTACYLTANTRCLLACESHASPTPC